jgi:hypothetical protein
VLAIRRRVFFATAQNLVFITAFAAGVIERTIFDRNREPIPFQVAMSIPLDQATSGDIVFQTEVNALSLGALEIVTVPGELYPELWLQGPNGQSYVERPEGADLPDAQEELPIQATVPDRGARAIINQANDALGYIIPKTQFDLSAPHAYDPEGQYGERNSLGPEIAGELRRAIDVLYAPNARDE